MAIMKECFSCCKSLDLNFFHKSKRNKDGFKNVCKQCCSKEIIDFKNTGDYLIIENKICTTCKIEKSALEFTKDLSKKDGLYSKCKTCCSIKVKAFYIKNCGYKQLQDRKYYENNKGSIMKRQLIYESNRYQKDIFFRLKRNISKRVNSGLKNQFSSKNNKSILKYLIYTMEELKVHLENQFEPWMNWDNHGKYSIKDWDDNDVSTWVWQIDHIIPHSDLPYNSMTDDNFKRCWALSNLRPLSAKQNLIDGVNRIRHK